MLRLCKGYRSLLLLDSAVCTPFLELTSDQAPPRMDKLPSSLADMTVFSALSTNSKILHLENAGRVREKNRFFYILFWIYSFVGLLDFKILHIKLKGRSRPYFRRINNSFALEYLDEIATFSESTNAQFAQSTQCWVTTRLNAFECFSKTVKY